MVFAGKTKSGNQHLWPRWWCLFFGGTYQQPGGGYGTCYSIASRILRYYREGWRQAGYGFFQWIWTQGPYSL